MRIPTFSQFQRESGLVSKEFDRLSTLLQQAETGKKLLRSSDDPVLANQVKSKQSFVNTLQSYFENGVVAQSRASIVGTSMQNVVNITSNIQTLIKKAESGTLNNTDRIGIAKELEGHLTSLLNIANTRDSNGGYVFSGSNTTSPAYVQVNGTFQYQGSTTPTMVNIAPDVSTIFNESGQGIFGDIYQGNGVFTVTTGSGNSGAVSSTPGSVIDSSAYVPDDYTITFVTNSSGRVGYQIIGATSGQVVPTPPATTPANAPDYVPGHDITFNGMSINVNGNAQVGDTLQINPSTTENIFNSLQNVINLLKTPVTNLGNLNQNITQADASFMQISQHLTAYQSEAGTRAAAINNQIETNESILSNQAITLSNLENADIVQVYSALSQQSLILQATQAGYMKMQEVLTKILQMQF